MHDKSINERIYSKPLPLGFQGQNGHNNGSMEQLRMQALGLGGV